MGYPDFPYPEQENSFLSSKDVLDYYQAYADKFDLRKHFKFEHHVVRVRPLLDESWEVIVRDLKFKNYETYTFDAVLVCNGHYNAIKLPKLKGWEKFEGKQLHSHDYRTPTQFKGEHVLVIGAGPSGVDWLKV